MKRQTRRQQQDSNYLFSLTYVSCMLRTEATDTAAKQALLYLY